MTYPTAVKQSFPVAYWRLGETSGTTAADEVGSLDGIYENSPFLNNGSLLIGDANPSVFFVAGGFLHRVNCGTDPAFNFTTACSCEALVNVPDTGYDISCGIVTKGILSPPSGYALYLTSRKPSFFVMVGTVWKNVTSTTVLTLGQTYHLVGKYDGAELSLWIDGVKDISLSVSGDMDTSGTGVYIGTANGSGGFEFRGGIDEVAMYNYALSDSDILNHYNESVSPTVDPPVETLNIPAMDFGISFNAPTPLFGEYNNVPALDFSINFPSINIIREPVSDTLLKPVYHLILTGSNDSTTDLILPMTSMQGRKRNGEPSYLSVVVPDGARFADDIALRPNGEIVVKRGWEFPDQTLQLEEISRATLETIREDTGGSSSSVTLSGHKTITFAQKSRTFEGANYKSIADGLRRYRLPYVDNFLNPGDEAFIDNTSFIVDSISYTISPRQETMEIAE